METDSHGERFELSGQKEYGMIHKDEIVGDIDTNEDSINDMVDKEKESGDTAPRSEGYKKLNFSIEQILNPEFGSNFRCYSFKHKTGK